MRLSTPLSVVWKILVAIAAIVGQQALGQTTVGIQPFGSYASGFDQISLADLGRKRDFLAVCTVWGCVV
jgi:hypothetical protein